ncbi:hypothetical protein E4191_03290 [Paracoccus liaowanqingii]|uniref:Acyltransferase n=1 Tax=Paracoccus liaowanqingii TaxID=2560053 RepID=A0A4V1BIS9_9RHOB|nr:hypothetical protein [Paracoccus liaowanqingii]QBX33852.1 hypothetical protein E4191_03290 [Paracoccus liaowanqingii]
MTHPSRRASAIDPLRLFLALSVVALHSGFPEAVPALVKQGLFNGLYRLAVPVFAVISGYYFWPALQGGGPGPICGESQRCTCCGWRSICRSMGRT